MPFFEKNNNFSLFDKEKYKPEINYRGNTLPISSDYVTDGVELVDSFEGFSTGWSDNGDGTYSCDGSQTGNSNLYTGYILTENINYATSYEIVSITAGSCKLLIGGSYQNTYENTVSIHNEVGIALGTSRIYIVADSDFIGVVRPISIQKVIQEPNKRYLDSGGSPKKPALLTYGEGKLFDGNGQAVDSSIPTGVGDSGTLSCMFSTNANVSYRYLIKESSGARFYLATNAYGQLLIGLADTSGTTNNSGIVVNDGALRFLSLVYNAGAFTLYINGVEVYCGTYQGTVLNSYINLMVDHLGITTDGFLNNIQVIGIPLTPAQILFLHNFPELFVYPKKELQDDGSYKWFPQSEYLNQDELDSFVALIPLNGKGAFVRNMIGYSEGVNEVINPSFDTDLSGWGVSATTRGTYTWDNGRCKIVNDGVDSYPNISQGFTVVENEYYLVEADIDIGTSTLARIHIYDTVNGSSYNQELVSSGKIKFIYKASSALSASLLVYNYEAGQTDTYMWVDNASFKHITNTHEIQNWTEAMDVDNLDTGSQLCFYDVDPLGVICGSNFKSIAMNGVAVPALAIPMTDTELNGAEGKWVIEFVIARELEGTTSYLLNSQVTGIGGLYLLVDKSWASSQCTLYLKNGDINYYLTDMFDASPHHIIFENDGSKIAMLTDGLVGAQLDHSFVPSGLSFADSTSKSPIGKLKDFKIWYGDNYYKYNREKSIAKGLIAKESLL